MAERVDIDALERLAVQASPVYPLDERREDDGVFRCPYCDGNGSVEGSALLSSSAEYCAGVQVFGIGEGHLDLERFFQAANPTAVLALIAEVRAARAVQP